MRRDEFKNYLSENGSNPNTCESRTTNCQNIENHYGNLDRLYLDGKLELLIKEFTYTRDHERDNLPARHRVPINGNIYDGTSTLKQALKKYLKFSQECPMESF